MPQISQEYQKVTGRPLLDKQIMEAGSYSESSWITRFGARSKDLAANREVASAAIEAQARKAVTVTEQQKDNQFFAEKTKEMTAPKVANAFDLEYDRDGNIMSDDSNKSRQAQGIQSRLNGLIELARDRGASAAQQERIAQDVVDSFEEVEVDDGIFFNGFNVLVPKGTLAQSPEGKNLEATDLILREIERAKNPNHPYNGKSNELIAEDLIRTWTDIVINQTAKRYNINGQ
jgi:hypothetical protein